MWGPGGVPRPCPCPSCPTSHPSTTSRSRGDTVTQTGAQRGAPVTPPHRARGFRAPEAPRELEATERLAQPGTGTGEGPERPVPLPGKGGPAPAGPWAVAAGPPAHSTESSGRRTMRPGERRGLSPGGTTAAGPHPPRDPRPAPPPGLPHGPAAPTEQCRPRRPLRRLPPAPGRPARSPGHHESRVRSSSGPGGRGARTARAPPAAPPLTSGPHPPARPHRAPVT